MHAATRPGGAPSAAVARAPSRAGVAPRTPSAWVHPHRGVGTPRPKSTVPHGLAQGRDEAYYQWIDEQGIDAPAIGIGYIGVGVADDNETYRGCVATAPINTGRVDLIVKILAALRRNLKVFSQFPHPI